MRTQHNTLKNIKSQSNIDLHCLKQVNEYLKLPTNAFSNAET